VCSAQLSLGTGNEYTSAGKETASQVVFEYTGNAPNLGEIVAKNDRGAKFFAFDKFELAYSQ
jgi:hypothetical protein